MNRKALSFFVVGLLVGAFATTACFAWIVRHRNQGDQAAATILKLAHSLDQNHPVHLAMVHMAERLEEKSQGSVKLEIFPNGQLGNETECIEQLQRGALAMTKTSSAPIESFVPDMAVFGVPYAFRDGEHFWKVAESEIGRQLLAQGKSVGLHGLCYYDAGARSFYTINKPVMTPTDLEGLKIRVQKSKTAMDMVEALGGSPTPIPWGELYTALQQKMVDGAENNTPSFYTNRHFEVCKHLTMDEHTRVPDLLLMSQKVWDALPPHVQSYVQEAANESSVYQRELWKRKSDEALAAIKEEGVEVHYPDKSLFVDLVSEMHKSYDGTSVGDLIRRIRETE